MTSRHEAGWVPDSQPAGYQGQHRSEPGHFTEEAIAQAVEWAERARSAQLAINALGAGPPGTSPHRACYCCGKVLMAIAGFIELTAEPGNDRRDFCGLECLHRQIHEDEQR